MHDELDASSPKYDDLPEEERPRGRYVLMAILGGLLIGIVILFISNSL